MEPLRLAYHGKCHYNAILHEDWTEEMCFVKEQAGELETAAIQKAHEEVIADAEFE